MAVYKTAQRKILLAFLKTHPDQQFSVKDIAAQLADNAISVSAVYRNLAALQEEGLIQYSVKRGMREGLYQYMDSEECKNCIHLTCTKCGQIRHMDHHLAEQMLNEIGKIDKFQICKAQTVLYGICDSCD